MTRRLPPKRPISTSLAPWDFERLYRAACERGVSPAEWIRDAVKVALSEAVPAGTDLVCADCGHMPSLHLRGGCRDKECRCIKYRSKP